ncbi:MAG: L-glutamate gamma-semialdehyde dehydrogenase, partial [Iodobacter sp.]
SLSAALLAGANTQWLAAPMLGEVLSYDPSRRQAVKNPADHLDLVGHVIEADVADVGNAYIHAANTGPVWQATAVSERAACLNRAAQLLESGMQPLLGLIVREAGKSLPNAIAEVREAVDFLRYYALQIEQDFANDSHRPLGPVVCISPWNFPLAIFMGQVAAALAAGNPVLAKPAEQTPLIAAEAVRILRAAGVPDGAVQLLPGRGETVGAALINDDRCAGVMFTGSTQVARLIAASLAERLDKEGRTIPLIAETGGQNCMIVDSSALAEQVVGDVLLSAFDSAGQRCSALRVLCLQEEAADHILHMLKGAMQELHLGKPDSLAVDVGPVIDAEAQQNITAHIEALKGRGAAVLQLPLPAHCQHGTYIAPALIEISSLSELTQEVFGPVLHIVRYRREALDQLIDDINATGFGLTFGVHTRIDETIAHVTGKVQAGNIYVNRNVIGAVVGVQPFGGEGLSGTGPKAGGPLYLPRLLSRRPAQTLPGDQAALAPLLAFHDALLAAGKTAEAARCSRYLAASGLGANIDLAGPTGERNRYMLHPRGPVLCIAATLPGAMAQFAAALASGNQAVLMAHPQADALLASLPSELRDRASIVSSLEQAGLIGAVLFEGDSDTLGEINRQLAKRAGPILQVQGLSAEALAAGEDYELARLLAERSISINTAAAGGNASLMSIS